MVEIMAGRGASVGATCPAGKIALNGSFQASSATQLDYPNLKVARMGVGIGSDSRSWSMYAVNSGTVTATVDVLVTCVPGGAETS
ncbi:hypothetical protein [Acrocarpospora pleiomorpha]|nr:hypothetical protein [Acrocarpospora pleiomorpha]